MPRYFIVFFLVLTIITVTGCRTGQINSREIDNENEGTIMPLKDLYKGDFLIGNIINTAYMSGQYFELLTTHYNTVTCENAMKPDALAPPGKPSSNDNWQYNFSTADSMVDRMLENGIPVHGHTLVWHRQTPSWLTTGTKEEVQSYLEKYIKDVISHYEGRVVSWDVVNEAIRGDFASSEAAPSGWKGEYLRRDSPWYRALGDDYIEIAFRAAREAAGPDVKLYYNDYGMHVRNKGIAVYNMIKDINERYAAQNNGKKLIDGMGMQGHWGLYIPDETRISGITYFDNVKFALENFISLGIIVDISELDVIAGTDEEGTGRNSTMSEVDAQRQAEVYAKLFRLFLENKEHIGRVTMWGMDDRNSWKSRGNPCLFDGDLKAKKAFDAVCSPDLF